MFQVFQRVLHEADQRILALRHLLQKRLLKFPASLDEQKKIIRNLVHLETPDDPAWNCAVGQYQYCAQLLFHCKDEFISIHDTPPGVLPRFLSFTWMISWSNQGTDNQFFNI